MVFIFTPWNDLLIFGITDLSKLKLISVLGFSAMLFQLTETESDNQLTD